MRIFVKRRFLSGTIGLASDGQEGEPNPLTALMVEPMIGMMMQSIRSATQPRLQPDVPAEEQSRSLSADEILDRYVMPPRNARGDIAGQASTPSADVHPAVVGDTGTGIGSGSGEMQVEVVDDAHTPVAPSAAVMHDDIAGESAQAGHAAMSNATVGSVAPAPSAASLNATDAPPLRQLPLQPDPSRLIHGVLYIYWLLRMQ